MDLPSKSTIVYFVLSCALALFVSGIIRYDLIAVLALLVLVFADVIPYSNAFDGFSNPAVITVAAVLVISRGLEKSGFTAAVKNLLDRLGDSPTLHVLVLSTIVGIASAFINNVGALALLLPLGIELAKRSGRSPSYLLMPMAFASLLGGMTTLIGTPPNLIVSEFRKKTMNVPFQMFDYAYVGLGVLFVGIAYLALLGWRLIPERRNQALDELFDIEHYVSDVSVEVDSKAIGTKLQELAAEFEQITFLAVHRNEIRYSYSKASDWLVLNAGDIITVRADSKSLKDLVDQFGLRLSGSCPSRDTIRSADREVVEAIVTRGSNAEGSNARRLELRSLFDTDLLAIARKGKSIGQERMHDVRFEPGDVLLLHMPLASMVETLRRLGLLPLARRELQIVTIQNLLVALGIFGAAIVATTFAGVPSTVAFVAAALIFVLVGIVRSREVYEAIDWPIIVLLGAMIPVGTAFETSGAAQDLTTRLLGFDFLESPVVMLAVLLVLSMFLSDILNNAAAAIVLCPIAVGLANSLNVSQDSFLMAISIGASCAFLTPVGHQSNTLVLGPGGYKFIDYARSGLILEILIVVVSIPLLTWAWPLDSKQTAIDGQRSEQRAADDSPPQETTGNN